MKDEQLFRSWFEEERRLFETNEPATYTDSDEWCMKKGWMAACSHKNQEYSNIMDAMTRTSQNNAKLKKEIDTLLTDRDFHEETVAELKSKINELETFIRADAISTNWENKEFQEATHYNWLDDEIRRVEHHNFNLQAENAKLRECVEFYANPDNYQKGSDFPHGFCIVFDSIPDDYERVKNHPFIKTSEIRENLSSYGGKCARQVLKELEGEK